MEKLVLKDFKAENGESSSIKAYIENGTFVVECYDCGESVKKFYGDWDFEYWIKVKEGQYPDNIMSLIKGCSSANEIKSWLEERDIPYDYSFWV